MKTRIGLTAFLAVLLAASSQSFGMGKSSKMHSSEMNPKIELKLAMRVLWQDHLNYTRNYIISAVAELPDIDFVSKRLLKNQDDIGDAIIPFYGTQAGNKLTSLLREHIMIATEVVKAAKGGDKKQLAIAQEKWTANSKEMAVFLNNANQNWPQKELEKMLQTHLDLATDEVVGRLTNDWAKDIKAYDEGHHHMLMYADMLTEGIIMQFPAKFK